MFLASARRHLDAATTPGGMWHCVQSMPVWADAASVFSAGFMALQDVQ